MKCSAHNFPGHRQGHNFYLALADFHLAQMREILSERPVVFVVVIFFDNGHNGSLGNKAGEIVDVAIGIIAGDAVAEPENFAYAEKIPEALLDFIATQLRIAIWIQETRFGSKQCAPAVYLDRAAFQYHAWIKNRQIEKLGDACGHNFIEIEGRILATPGVVIPIDNRETRIIIARQENRPVVPAPRFVRWNPIKRDAFHRESPQRCARLGFVRHVANVDANWLRFDKPFDHRPQSRQNTIE